MALSLLKGANFTCHDFECVTEYVNQWLAPTHLGPRTTTWLEVPQFGPLRRRQGRQRQRCGQGHLDGLHTFSFEFRATWRHKLRHAFGKAKPCCRGTRRVGCTSGRSPSCLKGCEYFEYVSKQGDSWWQYLTSNRGLPNHIILGIGLLLVFHDANDHFCARAKYYSVDQIRWWCSDGFEKTVCRLFRQWCSPCYL